MKDIIRSLDRFADRLEAGLDPKQLVIRFVQFWSQLGASCARYGVGDTPPAPLVSDPADVLIALDADGSGAFPACWWNLLYQLPGLYRVLWKREGVFDWKPSARSVDVLLLSLVELAHVAHARNGSEAVRYALAAYVHKTMYENVHAASPANLMWLTGCLPQMLYWRSRLKVLSI